MSDSARRHKPPFDIGLLLIERKSDVIAFVALILSSLSFLLALDWFVKRPDPQLFAPESVILTGLFEGDNQPRALALFALMSYANRGEVDQPWIAVDEYIRFSLPGSNYRYVHNSSGYGELSRVGDVLMSVLDKGRQAVPFSIGGGDVLAHLAEFSPNRRPPSHPEPGRDFLTIIDFARAMMTVWREQTHGQPFEQARRQHTVSLALDFCAKGLDGGIIGARCTVQLYYDDLWNLTGNKDRKLRIDSDPAGVLGQGWTIVNCFPEDFSLTTVCR